MLSTCPATAKPSERSDEVNQTCKQVWNAAIGVAPSRAANEAAKVTQNVTATTLNKSRPPVSMHIKQSQTKANCKY